MGDTDVTGGRQNSSAYSLSLNHEHLGVDNIIMRIRNAASKTKLPVTGLLKLGKFGILLS